MRTQQPIVSVVIPMYNVAKYIKGAIECVLNQTYQHFEIICVDDGCVDDTVKIVESFKDERIKIVSQHNQGLAAARNTGINNSQGMYVALLDADDLWCSSKLAEHVHHLQTNPFVGVSYCQSLFIDEEGKALGIGQYPKLDHITQRDILCRNPVGNGSAAVIRRQALNDIGKIELVDHHFTINYFDPELRQSEDLEFWVRLSLNTQWRFEGINKALTFYRVNDSGLSANIERQYDSWRSAIDRNREAHEDFFDNYGKLAEAYQKRYFARRAVQSGDGWKAFKLVHQALATDVRILFQEPVRTLLTYAACVAALLPQSVFKSLVHAGMRISGKYRIS